MEKMIQLLFIVVLFTTNVFSQDIIRPGLLSAQITISPSYNFSDNQSYFYLHGNIETYLNNKLSITGEGYYYLGNLSTNESLFDYNHSVFIGSSYHFTQDNNDFYIGIQPGISITKLSSKEVGSENTQTGINPIFSTVLGYNFYLNKIFHFIIHTRFVIGEHNYDNHEDLTELRFSAGLGFHF